MKFTDTEIQILKQLLSTAKHSYIRGFRCGNCKTIHDEKMTVHNADTQNRFASMVCKNCGEVERWEDVKIKTITFNLKKIRIFDLIEEV